MIETVDAFAGCAILTSKKSAEADLAKLALSRMRCETLSQRWDNGGLMFKAVAGALLFKICYDCLVVVGKWRRNLSLLGFSAAFYGIQMWCSDKARCYKQLAELYREGEKPDANRDRLALLVSEQRINGDVNRWW